MRPSGRDLSEMRPVSIETGFTKHAEGSVLIKVGDTHVLCTATIEDRVPPFIKGSGLGWVTAEYGMLPRATGSRMRREAAAGKQGGRTVEIQRLIGRSLRAGVDRVALCRFIDIGLRIHLATPRHRAEHEGGIHHDRAMDHEEEDQDQIVEHACVELIAGPIYRELDNGAPLIWDQKCQCEKQN